jgi:hypothetical protein
MAALGRGEAYGLLRPPTRRLRVRPGRGRCGRGLQEPALVKRGGMRGWSLGLAWAGCMCLGTSVSFHPAEQASNRAPRHGVPTQCMHACHSLLAVLAPGCAASDDRWRRIMGMSREDIPYTLHPRGGVPVVCGGCHSHGPLPFMSLPASSSDERATAQPPALGPLPRAPSRTLPAAFCCVLLV